jgi:hypothetical protein
MSEPANQEPLVGRSLGRYAFIGSKEYEGRPPRLYTWIVMQMTTKSGGRTLYGHHRHRKTKMGWIASDDAPLVITRAGFYLARVVVPYKTSDDSCVVALYSKEFFSFEEARSVAICMTAENTSVPRSKSPVPTSKEITMTSTLSNTMNANKQAASNAVIIEAGRVANQHLSRVIGKRLPPELRPYASTPIGKLVLANLALVVVQTLRPGNASLDGLVKAMVQAAYAEGLVSMNLDGLLDELLGNKQVAAAMAAADKKDGV